MQSARQRDGARSPPQRFAIDWRHGQQHMLRQCEAVFRITQAGSIARQSTGDWPRRLMAEVINPLPPRPSQSTAAFPSFPPKLTSMRWRICALLFFANTINYMDRQVLSFLAPMLQHSIGWTEAQYGYIVVAFQLAYALGLLVVGNFIDAVGVRLGYTLSIGLWSLASMSHSLA